MRVALWSLLGLLVGLVGGFAATVLGYIVYTNMFNVIDREGAYAMGVFFGIGPMVGIVAGILCAVALGVRAARRSPDQRS